MSLLVEMPEVLFLKIDVHGYEGQVLKDGEQTLRRTRFALIGANLLNHHIAAGSYGYVYNRLTEHTFVVRNISRSAIIDGQAFWADAL
jgi:methyltransferase FkbM-like protein